MMPIYLRCLGAESFGLVGFFAMSQSWLMLLDLGLTPTLSRQMACYKAGLLTGHELRKLLRTLEGFFGSLAFTTMMVGGCASSWLAMHWLKLEHLQFGEVGLCIFMMVIIAGFRWISGLYRSGLIGLEYQTLTNGIMATVATFKFVGVLPLLLFVSTKPILFFSYQAAIAIIESGIYSSLLYKRLEPISYSTKPSLQALKSVLPFAGSVAFTSVIWVVIMNLDKLLLSHFLPLREYGYFSVAIVVAGGIILLISPISQVIQPRLTILYAQEKRSQAIELFREVSQFISGLMAAVSVNVAVFSEPLLFAWTGDREVSLHAAPILFWYALGNGVVGVLTLPYLFQYATGNLRLHVIGSIIFSCIQIPAIAYTAWAFGAIGTGIVWFGSNFVSLLLWVPFVFQRYLKGMFLDWFVRDIVYAWVAASIPIAFFYLFVTSTTLRTSIFIQLLFVGCLSLLCGWLTGGLTRKRLVNFAARMIFRFDIE